MTIFSRIIRGEIPGYKIAENDRYYAFLDINPIQKGHTLVVPKLPEPEADYIFQLDDETLKGLSVFCKTVANGIQKATGCRRVGVAVLGMEVNHVHVHLIPLNKESDMDFRKEKMQLSSEQMSEIAHSIAQAIETV